MVTVLWQLGEKPRGRLRQVPCITARDLAQMLANQSLPPLPVDRLPERYRRMFAVILGGCVVGEDDEWATKTGTNEAHAEDRSRDVVDPSFRGHDLSLVGLQTMAALMSTLAVQLRSIKVCFWPSFSPKRPVGIREEFRPRRTKVSEERTRGRRTVAMRICGSGDRAGARTATGRDTSVVGFPAAEALDRPLQSAVRKCIGLIGQHERGVRCGGRKRVVGQDGSVPV
jgi:hypothetical protein